VDGDKLFVAVAKAGNVQSMGKLVGLTSIHWDHGQIWGKNGAEDKTINLQMIPKSLEVRLAPNRSDFAAASLLNKQLWQ
jgi:hypothetical protein